MSSCWICGDIADSEEHKFKASDIKRSLGKKIDAYYVSGDATKINSYKDKNLKFPKVICINCNNTLTRPHDDAYDIFVDFCFKNHEKILESSILNFEEIYGVNWKVEKANLCRYYAKHAGCKIVTSNIHADVNNLAEFIKGSTSVLDLILTFEMKAGVKAIMNIFNINSKYNHLYNSETTYWKSKQTLNFGGWLTNNYITTNWVFGKNINSNSLNIFTNKYEIVILSDSHFFEIQEENPDEEFSRLKFFDQYIVGFENGYKKTLQDKLKFFQNLIIINNDE